MVKYHLAEKKRYLNNYITREREVRLMDMETIGYFIYMDEQEKKAQQEEEEASQDDEENG